MQVKSHLSPTVMITSPAGEDLEGKSCSIQELHGEVHMLCFSDLCIIHHGTYHISTLCSIGYFVLFLFLN